VSISRGRDFASDKIEMRRSFFEGGVVVTDSYPC
jgi:hypothetical protein